MTPIRRKCFPLFSFMHFIAWLIPWPWDRDSWIYNQVPTQASFCEESTISEAQTDEFLPVIDNDLEYLTQEEAEQIIARFMEIPRSYDRLVFWTGIPREWVQQWADEHGMLKLTSAMGPLMDRKDPRCLRRYKELEEWSKYIKGASVIFARYACRRGIVRVLTLPPSWAGFIRPESTYRNIEEPVLKGRSGHCCAVQINTVHLLTTFEEIEYQTWPQNHIPEELRCRGRISLNFRLPRWTRKALKAATKKKLRSNCVSSTFYAAPKPANINVVLEASARTTSGPQSTEPPNCGKQPRDSPNAQGHSRLQSQQPQSKKKPQIQQTTSKNKQPQAQQTSSKKKQPKTQQSAIIKIEQLEKQQLSSRKQQPQSQQMSSKDKKPQTQQLLSKTKKSQTQQSPSKKKQRQKQETREQQPQDKQSHRQQSQSKKPQPQNSRQPQQGRELQSSKKLRIKGEA